MDFGWQGGKIKIDAMVAGLNGLDMMENNDILGQYLREGMLEGTGTDRLRYLPVRIENIYAAGAISFPKLPWPKSHATKRNGM